MSTEEDGEKGKDEERRRERRKPDRVKVRGKMQKDKVIQWNLSVTQRFNTKIIVHISEVFLFQKENNMYLYKVGTRSSVLIKQGILISEVALREVPL